MTGEEKHCTESEGAGMKEYIEREALKRELAPYEENDFSQQMDVILAIVDAQPTADVVEVTFCEDCRYYQDAKVNEKGFLICPASGMEITETDYCSYGERMDKENETGILKNT